MCGVAVKDAALASTAGRFDPAQSSHAMDCAIIDPRTQQPARRLAGATVRAPSCMIADALTKLVMIAPQSALLRQERASALIVSADGDVSVTSDWDGALAA